MGAVREEERRKERMKRAEEKKWLRERRGQRGEESGETGSSELETRHDSGFDSVQDSEKKGLQKNLLLLNTVKEKMEKCPNYRQNAKTGSDGGGQRGHTHRSCRTKSTFSAEICPVTGCRNVVVLWLWLVGRVRGARTELETWGADPPAPHRHNSM